MKDKNLIDRIRKIFYATIDTKTGWGKNELKQAYEAAIQEALFEQLDFTANNKQSNQKEAGK